ncbi:MAG TPA: hypothetical protein PKC21_06305 [Oligoflexia bacterium]|nr:hypothetical protein [Oligoflexia bacterium]HMR24947.1 hypothetical protein [Oligoflexia bacterium]
MDIKKRIGMLVIGLTLSASMYNCEILGENPSPFGLLTRNGIVEADITDTEDLGNGQTQVTDTWTNNQLDQSSAVIAFVLDASGSFEDGRETLIEEGIPKVVEYFGNQNIDACFMILGGYADNPNNPDFPISASASRVTLANGLVLDNPAGVPISSNNSMDNKCVCVNEYGSVSALVNQVKANAAQIESELLGVGESLIESAAALLTKPEILNPLVNAGECLRPEQQLYFVLAGDETSPILRPKDVPCVRNNNGNASCTNNSSDNGSYNAGDPVVFGNKDNNLYSQSTVYEEDPWDTRTGMAFADFNSVTGNWDINRTIEDYQDIFRTFFGALPGGFISVGHSSQGGPGEPGPGSHSNIAVAEMEMVKEFHSNLEDFQVPIKHLLGTPNIPAFVSEFDVLAQTLSTVAQYQQIFDTQARCPGSLSVSGDGQAINQANITEVSNTRFRITSPHNQVTNVQAVYILDEGNCS